MMNSSTEIPYKQPFLDPFNYPVRPKPVVKVQLQLKIHPKGTKLNYGIRNDKEQMELMAAVNACNPNGSNSTLEEWYDGSQRSLEIKNMMRFCGLNESIDLIPEEHSVDDTKEKNSTAESNLSSRRSRSSLSRVSNNACMGDRGHNLSKQSGSSITAGAEINYGAKNGGKAVAVDVKRDDKDSKAYANIQAKAVAVDVKRDDKDSKSYANIQAKAKAKAKAKSYADAFKSGAN